MKKTFVKPIAIEHQPAKQRIERFQSLLYGTWHSREDPAKRNMHHIGMLISWPAKELPESVPPPRSDPIQQRQAHGSPFVGKPAKLGFHTLQFDGQFLQSSQVK